MVTKQVYEAALLVTELWEILKTLPDERALMNQTYPGTSGGDSPLKERAAAAGRRQACISHQE